MKEGDKVRLNEKYTSCGQDTSGSVGIIKSINDNYVKVHFISGYCKTHRCQGDDVDSVCTFKLAEVDLVIEHNRNGANS